MALIVSGASAQWQRIDNTIGLEETYRPSFTVADDNYLYEALIIGPPYRMGLYRSSDDGASWTEMTGFPAHSILPKFFRVLANGRLVMGSPSSDATQGIFLFSDDQGMTWSEVRTSFPVSPTTVEWLGGSNYMAGTDGSQVIRSTDGGTTWSRIDGGPAQVGQVRAIGGSVIVITSIGQTMRSTDGGMSWSDIVLDPSLPAALNLCTSVWRVGGTIYLKRNAGPAYASTDEGATWTAKSGPIDGLLYLSVETSPDGNAWILWTLNAIYLSTDGGETATDIAEGTARESNESFCNVDYAVTNSHVVASSLCNSAPDNSGVFRHGFESSSDVDRESVAGPLRLELPVPTPATSVTSVTYDLPFSGAARLSLFDALGNEVAVLADGIVAAGAHTVTIDVAALPAGKYWVRLRSGEKTAVRALVVR